MLLGKEASKAPALLFIQARHQAVDHAMFLSYRAGWTHHTIVTLALMRLALLASSLLLQFARPVFVDSLV